MLAAVWPMAMPVKSKGEVVGWTLLDVQDWERLKGKNLHPLGSRGQYVAFGGGMSKMAVHRFVLGLTRGDGIDADHINHNTRDNRRCNLRRTTRSENMMNRSRGAQGRGRSKHRGVSWSRNAQKWIAYGRVNYKSIHLGVFVSEEEAAEAAARFRAERMPTSVE